MIADCRKCEGTGQVRGDTLLLSMPPQPGPPKTCPDCFGAGGFQTFYFTTVVLNGGLYKSPKCEDINEARTEFELAEKRYPEGRVRFNSITYNHWNAE